MKRPPRLASVMTPFPYSLDAGACVGDAWAMMDEHGVHHLPVKDGDEIVGIITNLAVQGRDAQTPVSSVYTRDPYVVELSTALEGVLRDMASRHLGSAIVTREGRLAGVFTCGDACLAFAEHLAELFPPPGGDEAA